MPEGTPENLFDLRPVEKHLIIYLRYMYGHDLDGARRLLEVLHDAVIADYDTDRHTPTQVEGAMFALCMARVLRGEEPYFC